MKHNKSPKDLDDLQARLQAAKARRDGPLEKSKLTDTTRGYKMASDFLAGSLVGGVIGWGLDWLFGTLPLFLILFGFVGFGAGISNILHSQKRAQDKGTSQRQD